MNRIYSSCIGHIFNSLFQHSWGLEIAQIARDDIRQKKEGKYGNIQDICLQNRQHIQVASLSMVCKYLDH